MSEHIKVLKARQIIKDSRVLWGLNPNAPITKQEMDQTLAQLEEKEHNHFLMGVAHDIETIINDINLHFYNSLEGSGRNRPVLEEAEDIKKYLYDALHTAYCTVEG